MKVAIKAVAFGAMAEALVAQALGTQWRFNGFLATPRNGWPYAILKVSTNGAMTVSFTSHPGSGHEQPEQFADDQLLA